LAAFTRLSYPPLPAMPALVLRQFSRCCRCGRCCPQVLETEAKPRWSWLPPALIAYNVAFTAVYLLLPAYFSFFVLTFIGMCIVVFARCLRLYRCVDRWQRQGTACAERAAPRRDIKPQLTPSVSTA
jgi:hypothetical protein